MRFYVQVVSVSIIASFGVIAITTDESGLNNRNSDYTSQNQRAQSRRISTGSTVNASPRVPFQSHNPFYERNNGRHQTRTATRRHRPHNHPAPPYAVQMEPLVQYSQRDPLYHQKQDGNNITANDNVIEETKSQGTRFDSEPESTNNAEISTHYGTPGVLDSQIQYDGSLYPPHYYKEPEPIIEIIIKESNESLPAPPTPQPIQHARPTKEPVQVFYVKYKKNPAGTSKNGEEEIVYDPPIPALTPTTADIEHEDPVPHEVTYQPPVTLPPPPSTTLRTIIHPDSEIYHGTGLRVTFGEPETKTSDSAVEEQSAPEPSIALPTPQFGAQNRDVSINLPAQSQFKRQQGPYHPVPQHIQGGLNQALNPPPPPTAIASLQPGTYQTPPPPPPQIQFQHQPQQFTQPQQKVVFPQQLPQQPLPFRPQHTNTLFPPQQHVQQHSQTLVQVQPSQQPIHLPSNQQLNQRPSIQQQNQQIQLHQQQTRQHNNPYASLHSQTQRTNFRGPQNSNLNHQQFDQQRVFPNQQEQIRLQQQQSHQKQQQHQQQQQQHQQLLHPQQQQQNQHTNHLQVQPIQIYQTLPQVPRQQFVRKPEDKQVNQHLQQLPSQPIHVQPQTEFNSNQFRIQLPNIQQPDIKLTKPPPRPSKPIHPLFAAHYQQQLQNQQQNIVPYNQQQQKHLQTEISIQPSTSLLLSSSQVPSTLQPQPLPNQQIQTQNQQIYHQQQNQKQLNKQIPVNIGPLNLGGGEIIQSIPAAEGHQFQDQFNKKTPLIFETNKQPFSTDQLIPQPTKPNFHQSLLPNSHYTPALKQTVYTTVKPPESTVFPPTKPSPVYTPEPSSPVYRPEYSQPISTTTETTGVDVNNVKEKSKEGDKKKKENIAALPEEVPDDLREQLLSSGILSNADIQILDYDKVGDIPIESLPPEALENFYGAGSAPVPVVVLPNKTSKAPVEMKVVRYNPSTKEGQKVEESYIQDNATQLDSVVLNDSKFNRYLPLKVSGANFPLPDVPQLHGRIINSVVVLAPVDYDFVKETQEEDQRSGRAAAIQVQGVRFIAGESLKKLIKEPTTENYKVWLAKEKNTPLSQQSVILLVTSPSEAESASIKEIFMYDISSGKVSKLRGELSSTFVEVAESNANSQEIDGLSPVSSIQERGDEDTFGLSSERKEIKVIAPVYTDENEKLTGFTNQDEDLAMAASEPELEQLENNSVLFNEAPLISSGYSKTMAYSSSHYPSEAESASIKEIFMYDISSGKVSKLRGELSSTFVEVAESNANSQEIDGLSPVSSIQERGDEDTFGLSSERKEIKVIAPVYTDENEKLTGFTNQDEDLAMAASEPELEQLENNSVLFNEAPLISSGYSKTMAYSSSH